RTRAGKAQSYCYVQMHIKDNAGNYVIENLMFLDNNGNLQQVDLADVEGYEAVSPHIETNSPRRRFVIDRMNICNNVEEGCPLGVAVYANAVDALKAVDTVFDS